MKEIGELNLPETVRYSDDHEWAREDAGHFSIGVSDYAQDQLGDIVYVELPEVGTELERGQEFGTVESVKAVSELYMPLTGEVVEVNLALEESPELLNTEPYGNGWIIKVKAGDSTEFDQLLDSTAYRALLEEG